MPRARVRSWPGPPSSFHPPFAESEGHSAWFDKVKLTIPQDSTLTTSGTTNRDTLAGLSRSPTDNMGCDTASESIYEDALTHISQETLPRISVESTGPPKTEQLCAEQLAAAQVGAEQSGGDDEPVAANKSGSTDNDITVNTGQPTPVQASVRPALAPRMIPAEQRLTKLERLRSFNPRSSVRLLADESGEFSPENEKILDQFVFALSTHWIMVLRDLGLPMFIPCLVFVTDHSSPPKSLGTYICIKGFLMEKHIRRFHRLVSQRVVRRHYAPLKICYDTRLIDYAASDDVTEDTDVTMTTPDTLCGRVLRTRREDGSEYVTTIGGFITYGDSRYIMTSSDHSGCSHVSDSVGTTSVSSGSTDSESDEDWCSISPTVTSSEEEFDEDVEGPLLCEPVRTGVKPGARPRGPGSENAHPVFHLRDQRDVLQVDSPGIVGDDGDNSHWRLIPAPEDMLALNHISVPAGVFGTSPTSGYIQDHRTWNGIKPGTSVAINAGLSGISGGNIIGRPSYLFSNGKLQQVWTINLQPNTTLQRGDSGSWVVDSSLHVLGSILAISDGSAYMVSLDQQLQQISDVLRPGQEAHSDSTARVEVASTTNILPDHRISDFDGTDVMKPTISLGDQTTPNSSAGKDKDPSPPPSARSLPIPCPTDITQSLRGSNEGERSMISVQEVSGSLDDASWLSSIRRDSLVRRAASVNEEFESIPPQPSGGGGFGQFTIICLILNRTIGSGIFTQPTNVLNLTGSTTLSLIVWVVAGFLTWAIAVWWTETALSNPRHHIQPPKQKYRVAESVLVPRSGAESLYVKSIFTKSFLLKYTIWISSLSPLFVQSITITSNAIQFGLGMTSITSNYGNDRSGFSSLGELGVTLWASAAVGFCSALTIWMSRRSGIWLNNAFAGVKVVILVAFILIGLLNNNRNLNRPAHPTSFSRPEPELPAASPGIEDMVTALSLAIFAYSGLEEVLIAVDAGQPQRRQLARPAFTAMGIIAILFTFVNIAFYSSVLPEDSTDSLDVVSTFFETFLGGIFNNPEAAKIGLSCVLAFSALGNILSVTWTASSVWAHSNKEGLSVSWDPSHWFFLGLPPRRQEIAKEGILPFSLTFATPGQSHVGFARKANGKKRQRSHIWGPVLAPGFFSVILITATLFIGSSHSSVYGFLTVLIGYTNTIIPAIGLVACILCIKYMEHKSLLIQPFRAIVQLLANLASNLGRSAGILKLGLRNPPGPSLTTVSGLRVFRRMNSSPTSKPTPWPRLSRMASYCRRFAFPTVMGLFAFVTYRQAERSMIDMFTAEDTSGQWIDFHCGPDEISPAELVALVTIVGVFFIVPSVYLCLYIAVQKRRKKETQFRKKETQFRKKETQFRKKETQFRKVWKGKAEYGR